MPSRAGHQATPVSQSKYFLTSPLPTNTPFPNRILFTGGRNEAHTPLKADALAYNDVEFSPQQETPIFVNCMSDVTPEIGREMVVSRR